MMPPKSLRISALPSLGDSVRVLFFNVVVLELFGEI